MGLARVNTKLSSMFRTEENKVEAEKETNEKEKKLTKIYKRRQGQRQEKIQRQMTDRSQQKFRIRMNSLRVRTLDLDDFSIESKSVSKESMESANMAMNL